MASAAAEGTAWTRTGLRFGNAAALVSYSLCVLVLAGWVLLLRANWQGTLGFDDAFMFYRYAVNMRQGLGMSWNLDGVHTYGETAPLWGLAVYGLSYLPLNASRVLEVGSWLSSVAAFGAMAWAVSANAEHAWMRSPWRVAGLVMLPLAAFENYRATALTGMETMLGVALCAVFVGLVLRWAASGKAETRWAEGAGLAGLLLFLTRPEAGLVVVLFPCVVALVMRRGSGAGLARLLAVFGGGATAELLVCRRYFGTALPLSFSMKSAHGYEGYAKYWHPTVALLEFLAGMVPFLLLMTMLARRADWRMMAAFGTPLLCVAVYLDRVLQIMNTFSRYYLPYTPLIVVPALLVLDRWMVRGTGGEEVRRRFSGMSRTWRLGLGGMLVLLLVPRIRAAVGLAVDRLTEPKQYAYEPVELQPEDGDELPEHSTVELWRVVPSVLFRNLPRGATIASSEVGYVGASTPQANVIDLAGLNDAEIALRGFSVERLLARKPEVIWMPHRDYTWERGVMLSNGEFLKQYEVIAGAAGSGIAIRRDGPHRELLEANLRELWNDLYPGIAMDEYMVQTASWSGRKELVEDRSE